MDIDSEHPKTIDQPEIGFPVLLSLTAFAGLVDVCGLTLLKDIFVSFMSGNTTLLGAAIAHGDLARIGLISSIIVSFVIGSAAGMALGIVSGHLRLPVVLLAVSFILAGSQVVPMIAAQAMALSMGAINASLNHVDSVKVSITYVTGTLVKVGQGLGRWLCGERKGWGWLAQGLSWVGVLCGAVVGTLALNHDQQTTFAALPAIGSLLAAAIWGTMHM